MAGADYSRFIKGDCQRCGAELPKTSTLQSKTHCFRCLRDLGWRGENVEGQRGESGGSDMDTCGG
jgi:hypothetical protein